MDVKTIGHSTSFPELSFKVNLESSFLTSVTVKSLLPVFCKSSVLESVDPLYIEPKLSSEYCFQNPGALVLIVPFTKIKLADELSTRDATTLVTLKE